MSIVLSCPSCTTRYRADPQAIGAGGRRVRCASCGHVWAAEVEDPAGLPPVESVPADEPKPEPKPHTAFRERQAKKARTMSAAMAGTAWGGLLAACAVLAVTSWIFRVDIVTLWPRASSAYAAVGADVNPWGFSVGELAISRDVDHGVPLLIIEGDIHNFDRRSRAVPGLRAILRDEQGESVLEWSVSMPAGRVDAGKRRDFRTVVTDPPPEAVEVEVAMVDAPAHGNAPVEDEPAEAAETPGDPVAPPYAAPDPETPAAETPEPGHH